MSVLLVYNHIQTNKNENINDIQILKDKAKWIGNGFCKKFDPYCCGT